MTSSAPPPIDSSRESRKYRDDQWSLHVAHTTVELQAGVGDLAHQPSGLELGDRWRTGGVVAVDHGLRRRVVVVLQQVDLGQQLRQPVLDRLVGQQRLAERLAVAQIVDRAAAGPAPCRHARCSSR